MPPLIVYILMLFMGLYAVILLVELSIYHTVKKFALEGSILVCIFFLLRLTVDFPSTRQAFGGASPVATIAIMFVCTLLGMAAHYLFYLEGPFSWSSFFKPLVISPIVLLPLIGSVQKTADIEPIQLISFGVLSFQNGFFWREVFKHAKKKI